MDQPRRDALFIALLRDIRNRLDHASSIGVQAQACGDNGNTTKGIEIALDVEPILYEVNTLLNAASLIYRIKDDSGNVNVHYGLRNRSAAFLGQSWMPESAGAKLDVWALRSRGIISFFGRQFPLFGRS